MNENKYGSKKEGVPGNRPDKGRAAGTPFVSKYQAFESIKTLYSGTGFTGEGFAEYLILRQGRKLVHLQALVFKRGMKIVIHCNLNFRMS